MNNLKKYIIALFCTLFFGNINYAQQVSVSGNHTIQQLIEDIFIDNPCIEISNIRVNGHTFNNNGGNSWGYFNNNNTTFPLDEGIVLTTGKLSDVSGPNANILSEGPSSWAGDQDLELHTNTRNTFNATSIEFNFVPTSNTIRFEYVFASEQYLLTGTASQCHYTDAFAFLLKNTTTNGAVINLATVPNTNTPVTSSTIRGNGGLCPAVNAQYFGSYNTINSPIAYNGNTVPLVAQATVIPGNTYHIKIVIADQGNQLYDSAVFLRANSFESVIDLGEDRLMANGNSLCANENLVLNAFIPNVQSYVWYKNDVIIANASTAELNVTESGVYSVQITQNNGCITRGTITVEKEIFAYEDVITVSGCALSGIDQMTFNLNEHIPTITNENYQTLRFYTTNTNGALSNEILNPASFSITRNTTIYAQITSNSDCRYISTIHLEINSSNVPPFQSLNCDFDGTIDGFINLTTTELANGIRDQNNWNANYTFSFHWTAEDAINDNNRIANNFRNTIAYQQNIYARVLLNDNCHSIIPIQITILDSEPLTPKRKFICKDKTLELTASADNTIYVWNTNEITRTITINSPGTYNVRYLNEQGCEITEVFEVILSDIPSSISATSSDFSEADNTVTVSVNGISDYEYSIDGVNYQYSNQFTGLKEGTYTIYVRDLNGCGVVTTEAIVLDYPKFFTPNGDGINDIWRIQNLHTLDSNAIIRIFDRYDRLIVVFKANYGWDGTSNGHILQSTDYWFTVTFSKGTVMRGHFHLKK